MINKHIKQELCNQDIEQGPDHHNYTTYNAQLIYHYHLSNVHLWGFIKNENKYKAILW